MKNLLAVCMIATSTLIWAGEPPAPPSHAGSVVTGQVLEVKDVASYSYLRIKTENGETWAAVGKAAVKKGDKVTIENAMVMNNFESKSLKKTFPSIIFGTLSGTGGASGPGHNLAATHSGSAKEVDAVDIHVPKASGANAQTVAEIITKSAELKDKIVQVRGKVVKYTPEVMGKNWVHLRDGSGSAANNTNDILVATASKTKIGDIVTAKGTVRTDKNLGSGYFYKVLIEEATLQP